MQKLAYLFHSIQHYIVSDHKAEAIVGTSAAGVTGFISSREMDITHELLYRDINTILMAAIAAVVGWFVTRFLKKCFGDK